MDKPAPKTNSQTVTRSALTVASGTLLSRIFGALRDAVIAAVFSLKHTDAFFIAFTIPNSLRVLLGEGAISGAFVPVLSQTHEREPERYNHVFGALFGMMGLILFAVTALGVLCAPYLVSMFAAGYLEHPEKFDLTVQLTQVVFPYIFLMGIAALFTASLHTLGVFSVPAFSPVFLNIALISAAFVLPSWLRLHGYPAVLSLSLGALAGGVLQILSQLPVLLKRKAMALPRIDFKDPAVRKALRLLLPLILGLGTYQLNVMASRLLASFLATGAQSYLYYSQRLVEIPQGMIALAIGAAALPTLSKLISKGEHQAAQQTLNDAWRLSLFITIPATVFLTGFADATVSVVLGRGNFDSEQIRQTGAALRAQAIGIWAISSVRILIPLFHANSDTRSPVKASMINLAIFVTSSVVLMQFWGHQGIAASIALAGIAQLAVLILLSRRTGLSPSLRPVLHSSWRIVVCSMPMMLLLLGVNHFFNWAVQKSSWLSIAVYLGTTLLAAIVYTGMAKLIRLPEQQHFFDAFRRRK
ncbi:MAG: murein biosynthesis integral membrane protein MurJ [Myxococcales bacterium]|nr:MAG: murein biosynthesis integral membrane protein MurJ [Myxococcales bacterium]